MLVVRQHLSLRKLEKEAAGLDPPPSIEHRPKTRAECRDGPRPCPFLGCRHHLALEAKSGAIRLIGESAEDLLAMGQTCSLDVADKGQHSLPEVAALLGVSRQRVSQVEIAALRKLRRQMIAQVGSIAEDLMPDLFAIANSETHPQNSEILPGNDNSGAA